VKRCWVAIATLAVLGALGAMAQTFAPAPVDSIVMPRLEIEDHEEGPMFSAAVAAVAAPSAPTPPGTPSLWFDGSDIDGDGSNNSAYTDGDPVTTWVDKGSLGVDATQATAAAKPTYKTGGPGGSDYLLFDGGDRLWTGAAAFSTLAQPNTIAVLCNTTNATTTRNVVSSGISTNEHTVGLYPGNTYLRAGNTSPNGTAPNLNTWEALIGTFDGASSTIYISGSSYSISNIGAEVPDNLIVGAGSDTGTNPWLGGVIDVIVYDTIGSVTASDIETYWEGETTTLPVAGTP
jgi:hypothetical protein